ncbi:MAG TPA: TolC family protein [Acidobacteriota bacterium]|nr:TolC family protein [Acidobacteriota bacterium]
MKNTAFLLLMTLAAGAARAGEMTLSDAAGLMIRNNPALAQKQIQSQMAQEQSTRSRAAYLPQLDFVQGWTRSNNPVFSFGSLLNQQRFSEANFAIDSLNNPDPLTDVSSKFQLGWLLYDFGRRESQVHTAASMARVAQLTQEAARTGLLQELVRRYYAVSLAQQRLASAQDSLDSAESRLTQATERVAQGLAVATESLSAQVYAARARQEKIDAENQVRLAHAALNEVLGTPGAEDTTTTPLKETTFEDHDLTWWMQQMRANRPELKMAAEGVKIAGSQVTASRAGFLPSIQAYSAYEWHGDSLSYSGENWTAGLELRWNLFRGFSDSAEVSTAKLKEREADQRRRETENGLALQLQTAYYKMDSAREKLKVAAAVLDQAAENRRIYADRYASGMASIQDSLQAEASQSESRLMYLMNLYEFHVAHAELLAAAGMPDQIVAGDAL